MAPGHGGGTGSFDVTEALAGAPGGNGARPDANRGGEPRRDDLPYFADDTDGGNRRGPAAARRRARPRPSRRPAGPPGPTGGPVTGDGPMTPPGAARGAGAPVVARPSRRSAPAPAAD